MTRTLTAFRRVSRHAVGVAHADATLADGGVGAARARARLRRTRCEGKLQIARVLQLAPILHVTRPPRQAEAKGRRARRNAPKKYGGKARTKATNRSRARDLPNGNAARSAQMEVRTILFGEALVLCAKHGHSPLASLILEYTAPLSGLMVADTVNYVDSDGLFSFPFLSFPLP